MLRWFSGVGRRPSMWARDFVIAEPVGCKLAEKATTRGQGSQMNDKTFNTFWREEKKYFVRTNVLDI